MKSGLTRTVAAALLATPLVVNANLISNPGFETGDLTGWSCTGADFCGANDASPHSGSYNARGFDNDGFATLSQVIATIVGQAYDFSFWSGTDFPSEAGNILRYEISGKSIVTVPTTSRYSMTSDSFVATAASTTVSFLFETDDGTGTWFIDDVSVEGGQVPEPATLALLALGLAGLGFSRRRAH